MEGQKRLLRRLSVRGAESDKPRVCIRGLKPRYAIWSMGNFVGLPCAASRRKRLEYNEACVPRFKLRWMTGLERGWRCWSRNWDGGLPEWFEKGWALWR